MRLNLKDAYGRRLENLRISVTNSCNYRCIFCHAEGDPKGVTPGRIDKLSPLSPKDYWAVARAAASLGVTGFKLTGGEPLLRLDIVEIVASIRDAAPESDISMTTNGYLLSLLAHRLREAGMDRLNISIHSTRREVYEKITGVDGLGKALAGLKAAVDAGFESIKINAVILRGINEDEIWRLIELAGSHGATLQLIELHPVGMGAQFFNKYYYPLAKVEKMLMDRASKVTIRSMHNRAVYDVDGVSIEVVRPYGNPLFCAGCNRVRLLAEGLLSPCLNWKGPYVNLASRLRGTKTLEDKVRAAKEALMEANSMRRPYYMWPLRREAILSCMPQRIARDAYTARIQVPKRTSSTA